MWQRGRKRWSNLIGPPIGMLRRDDDVVGIEMMAAGFDAPPFPVFAISAMRVFSKMRPPGRR